MIQCTVSQDVVNTSLLETAAEIDVNDRSFQHVQ